jgi:indole-3-glycerol phosphate synthase
MVNNILEKIKMYKLEEIKFSKNFVTSSELEQTARSQKPPLQFEHNLRIKQKESYGIIAEIKKASPSKGIIRNDFRVSEIAKSYEMGGAACLSILTDFPSFQGKNEYLIQAKSSSSLPVLRKDFLYDTYQVTESRAIGADCILIIIASVSDSQAQELEESALSWGMDVLLEVHNEHELERALLLKSKLIGINNRNLKTFEICLKTTEKLSKKIPKDYLIVSESGLTTKADLNRMAQLDVKSFLIGESLMRQNNIREAIERLLL